MLTNVFFTFSPILRLSSFGTLYQSAIPLIAYSDIDNIEIGLMSSKIQEAEYDKGTVIAKIGASVAPGLYVIRSGTVSLSNDKGTKDLGAGEVFGFGGSTLILTNALKGENLTWQQHGFVALTTNAAAYLGERYLRANTVVAEHEAVVTENAKVGILTLESMNDVLYDVMRLGQDRKSTIDPSITKDNLVKMRILGAGTFGQVWLTRDDQTNSAYALKIQYKRELIEFGQARGVIREKQVMERMRHPFVMSIVNAQQDPTCLYMIMNLLQGGELRTQMRNRKRKCLTESSARFYAAGILEGLSYMHRRYYVYRDLKGENVLLDKDGYCVIVDLGFGTLFSCILGDFCLLSARICRMSCRRMLSHCAFVICRRFSSQVCSRQDVYFLWYSRVHRKSTHFWFLSRRSLFVLSQTPVVILYTNRPLK